MNTNSPTKKQVAIVIGASSGMGLGITQALLQHGYRVVANSRNISKSLEKDFEMYAIGFLAGMFFVGVQLLQKYDMWARLIGINYLKRCSFRNDNLIKEVWDWLVIQAQSRFRKLFLRRYIEQQFIE